MFRFSNKGLINYWIEREMVKVARMSTDGSNKKH